MQFKHGQTVHKTAIDRDEGRNYRQKIQMGRQTNSELEKKGIKSRKKCITFHEARRNVTQKSVTTKYANFLHK